MEIFNQKEQIRDRILAYIDIESDNDDLNTFTQLKEKINQEISNNADLEEFLHLIISISNNHRRNPYFFERIKQILFLIKDQIKQNISISELFELFSTNKRLQLILFELEIISIKDPAIEAFFKRSISNYAIFNKQKEGSDTLTKSSRYKEGAMMSSPTNTNDKSYKKHENLICYFYTEIESTIDQITKENTYKKNTQFSEFSEFSKNREIGENDSIICSLIRNDLIDEFVPYVSKKNCSLSSQIVLSIFETNEFLIKNSHITSLIEYAAFNGSIQIFNYLRLNNVELKPTLWLYSIHGKNAEIIHLLEENKVLPPKNNFNICLVEAIKCHHDDIANYLQERYQFLMKNNDIRIFKLANMEMPIPMLAPIRIGLMNRRHQNRNNFNRGYYLMNNDENDFFFTSEIVRNTSYYCFKYHNYKFIQNYFTNDNSNLLNSCKYGYYSIVDLLLNQETNDNNINDLNIENLLKAAAKNNKVSIVYLLLSKFNIQIENRCFEGCKKLTKIKIPYSKYQIGRKSFEECESLIEVELPSSITKILDSAFEKCYLLNEIVIPSSVKELGKYCFNQCTSLKNVKILGPITVLQQSTFDGCSSLTKVELPFTLKSIGSFCFNLCSSLVEIIIPSSVIEIEKCAFSECSSLKKIEISKSLKEIKDNLFFNCSSLIDVKIPSSVLNIEKNAFNRCSSLKQISIPKSVVSIGMNSFANCSSLEKVVFDSPSSLNFVGSRSFEQCSSLKEISFPKSITSFGCDILIGCSSLEHVTILQQQPVDAKRLGIENEKNIIEKE